MFISVHVQLRSKYAPPAVWYFATSYHLPSYFDTEYVGSVGGLEHDAARLIVIKPKIKEALMS